MMSTTSQMTVKPTSCNTPRACVPVARIPGLAGSSLKGTRVATRRSASSAVSRKAQNVTASAATAVDSPAEVRRIKCFCSWKQAVGVVYDRPPVCKRTFATNGDVLGVLRDI